MADISMVERFDAFCKDYDILEKHHGSLSMLAEMAHIFGLELEPVMRPKPDPLVEVLKALPVGRVSLETYARNVRAALEARGLEIREKNDDQ